MGEKKYEVARSRIQDELAASGGQATIPSPGEHRGSFLDFMTTFRATHPAFARELEEAWFAEDEPGVPVAQRGGKGNWTRERWTSLSRTLFMRQALDGRTWVWDKSKSGVWTLTAVIGGGLVLWTLSLTPPPRAQQVSQAASAESGANVSGAYLSAKKPAADQGDAGATEAPPTQPVEEATSKPDQGETEETRQRAGENSKRAQAETTEDADNDSPFTNRDGQRPANGGPPPPPPGLTSVEVEASVPAPPSEGSPFQAPASSPASAVPTRQDSVRPPVVLPSEKDGPLTVTRPLPAAVETTPPPFGGDETLPDPTPARNPETEVQRRPLPAAIATTPPPFGGEEALPDSASARSPKTGIQRRPSPESSPPPFGGSDAEEGNTLIYQNETPAAAPGTAGAQAPDNALVFEAGPEREAQVAGNTSAASSALLFEAGDPPARSGTSEPEQAGGLTFADVPTDPNAPNFDPTQQVQAQLVTGINAPARGEVPVLATSPEGTWIGTATVDVQLGRVNLEFTRLYRGGKYYDVQALAYQAQGGNLLQGLSAPIKAVAPQLGQQLVRQTINGLSTYAENLVSSGTTTVSGNFATTTRTTPSLLSTLAGEAARVFRVQGETQVFSSVAQLPSGTTFVILSGLAGR